EAVKPCCKEHRNSKSFERAAGDSISPGVAAPVETLGQGVDLVVMPPGKCQELGGEVLKPIAALRKPNRAAFEQVVLRNGAGLLVGIRLVGRDIDRPLAQALDQTAADRGVLDQKGGGGAIVLLDLHYLSFELFKGKAATDHFKDEEDFRA